jgi:hypothetical protein
MLVFSWVTLMSQLRAPLSREAAANQLNQIDRIRTSICRMCIAQGR